MGGLRPDGVHHVEIERRFAHHPRSLPFSQWSHQRSASCRKPTAGAGIASCGYRCAQGPTVTLCGTRRCSASRKRRVAIQIRPAAPEPGRAFDRAVVEAHRAVLPVFVERLMLQPDLRPEPFRLEPLQPHRAPALADDRRIRRPGIEDLHDAAPPEVVVEQATAGVMNALGETVVGAHHGDDGLERGRPARGDLQGVVSAPGLAHHADFAPSTRAGARSSRSLRAHRPAPGAGTHRAGFRPTRPSRACRRAPQHSRVRRTSDACPRRAGA